MLSSKIFERHFTFTMKFLLYIRNCRLAISINIGVVRQNRQDIKQKKEGSDVNLLPSFACI